jgi:hypothetical protein
MTAHAGEIVAARSKVYKYACLHLYANCSHPDTVQGGTVGAYYGHRWDMIYDIFVNCNWVDTRWQLYNTHLHTNNAQNDTKQIKHRTTQNKQYIEQHKNFENNTNILEDLFHFLGF